MKEIKNQFILCEGFQSFTLAAAKKIRYKSFLIGVCKKKIQSEGKQQDNTDVLDLF